jgi:hypothetical protein
MLRNNYLSFLLYNGVINNSNLIRDLLTYGQIEWQTKLCFIAYNSYSSWLQVLIKAEMNDELENFTTNCTTAIITSTAKRRQIIRVTSAASTVTDRAANKQIHHAVWRAECWFKEMKIKRCLATEDIDITIQLYSKYCRISEGSCLQF